MAKYKSTNIGFTTSKPETNNRSFGSEKQFSLVIPIILILFTISMLAGIMANKDFSLLSFLRYVAGSPAIDLQSALTKTAKFYNDLPQWLEPIVRVLTPEKVLQFFEVFISSIANSFTFIFHLLTYFFI